MTIVIAHRGASYYELENTPSAFLKAINLKTDAIEFDIRLTKDKIPVVVHDRNIYKMTGVSKIIKNMTFYELKRILTLNNEKILSLSEALDLIGDKAICKIDIKEKEAMHAVLSELESRQLYKNVIITSQYVEVIKYIAMHYSSLILELGMNKEDDPKHIIKKASNIGAHIVGLYYKYTKPLILEELHSRNLKAHVWPVNTLKDFLFFYNLGIAGITTSRPDLKSFTQFYF